MRYAIISDIHGNLPALDAVLEDLKTQRIDEFLFLGDYFEDMPFPNEVVEKISSIKQKKVIKGNKEEYLEKYYAGDFPDRSLMQFAPLFWNFDELTKENTDWLLSLPKEIDFTDGEYEVHLAHSIKDFTGVAESGIMRSRNFTKEMRKSPFSKEEFSVRTRKELTENKEQKEAVNSLPEGIYLFGHSHLQWNAEIEGKIFINPGSCGFQLGVDPKVPYTILDIGEAVRIEERSVAYDNVEAIELLKNSKLYEVAPDWCKHLEVHIGKGEESVSFFLQFLIEVADELGDTERPVKNSTWIEACRRWEW